jgi:hypothetical protein
MRQQPAQPRREESVSGCVAVDDPQRDEWQDRKAEAAVPPEGEVREEGQLLGRRRRQRRVVESVEDPAERVADLAGQFAALA